MKAHRIKAECQICKRRANKQFTQYYEWYSNDGARLVWNVSTAQRLLYTRSLMLRMGVQGVAPIEMYTLPTEIMDQLIEKIEIDEEHVGHVDISFCGISVVIQYGGEEGLMLIDGNHRAVRAYKEGKPFVVAILNPDEEKAARCDEEAVRHMDESKWVGAVVEALSRPGSK